MLTEEGHRKRKWGPFPALRQVLEHTAPSNQSSSISTPFDELGWIIDIARRAQEQRKALLRSARETPELRIQMAEDLSKLGDRLAACQQILDEEIRGIKAVCDDVHCM